MRRTIDYKATPNRRYPFPKRLNLIVADKPAPPRVPPPKVSPVVAKYIQSVPDTASQQSPKSSSESKFKIDKETKNMTRRVANVAVPQGVGDIFWVYQKLYNHFDEIHFRIVVSNLQDKVEQRSMPLLKDMPKVRNIVLEQLPRRRVVQLFNTVYHMDKILASRSEGVETFDFSCNYWLDRGHKLEDLDQNYDVAWEIPMPIEDPGNLPDKYLAFYASGHCLKDRKVWGVEKWYTLIQSFLDRSGSMPIQIIGADFDKPMMLEMEKKFKQHNIECYIWESQCLSKLCYILKNAEYFIGYQSGLNVLADNLNTRQLMIYFHYLRKMQDAWVKPQNRTNGLFSYGYFNEAVETVAEKINYEKTS